MDQTIKAIRLIYESIAKLETSLNGVKYENK